MMCHPLFPPTTKFCNIAIASLLTMFCLTPPAFAQQEIKLTVCSGQAPVFPFIRQITQTLIPTVNAELAKTGKTKITCGTASQL